MSVKFQKKYVYKRTERCRYKSYWFSDLTIKGCGKIMSLSYLDKFCFIVLSHIMFIPDEK